MKLFSGHGSLSLILAGIAAGAIAANLLVIPGYMGDDAFIHFTYVRNILEQGTCSYNTPSPTYGSTSILWVALCAAVSWFTGSIPATARVLSGLFFFGTAMMFARYLSRAVRLEGVALVSGYAMFLANAVLFRWMLTGMEVDLMLFVSVLLLTFWDPRHPIRSGALTLMAYLTRPEFLLFPFTIGALIAFRRGWRNAPAIRTLIATVLLFSCWFIFARAYFSALFPLTILKSGSGADVASIIRYFKILLGTYPDLLLLGLVLAWRRRSIWKRVGAIPLAELVLVLFAGGVMLVYLVKGTSMISRYLLVIHPVIVLFVLRGLSLAGSRTWLVRGALGVAAVQFVLFLTVHLSPIRSFVSGFQSTYAAVGQMLERSSQNDTGSVMVSDVGMIGYYTRRPVIDLVGLTSHHVDEAGSRNEAVVLERFRPQYAVLKLDTISLDAFVGKWSKEVKDLSRIRVLYHGHMGPLGVLSAPGQHFDVYAIELKYKTAGPMVPHAGAGD